MNSFRVLLCVVLLGIPGLFNGGAVCEAACSVGEITVCGTCVSTSIAVLIGPTRFITVTTTLDVIDPLDGLVSLREAFLVANFVGGNVEIDLPLTGLCTLTIPGRGEDLSCTGDLDVPVASGLTILSFRSLAAVSGVDGGQIDRIIDIAKTGMTFQTLGIFPTQFQNGYLLETNPVATSYGGAIRLVLPLTVATNLCVFTNNTIRAPISCDTDYCGVFGGAIGIDCSSPSSAQAVTVNLGTSTYINNTVYDTRTTSTVRRSLGGAVGISGFSSTRTILLTGLGTIFTNNTAEHGGGAVGIQQSVRAIFGATFTGNRAEYLGNSSSQLSSSGGAILYEFKTISPLNAVLLNFDDSLFVGNSATMDGGAVAVQETSITATTVVFPVTGSDFNMTGNTASRRGGAYFASHRVSTTFSQSYILRNRVVADTTGLIGNALVGGGGMALDALSTTIVSRCILDGNVARELGGAILAIDLPGGQTTSLLHSLSVMNSIIRNNVARVGGAQYLGLDVLATTLITSIVTNNSAIASNSSFTANDGCGGAFAYVTSPSSIAVATPLSFQRSTISHNSATLYGGAFFMVQAVIPSSTQVFSQCTVSTNTAAAGGGFYITGSGAINMLTSLRACTVLLNNASLTDRGGGVDLSVASVNYRFSVVTSVIGDNYSPISNEALYSEDVHKESSFTGLYQSNGYNLIEDTSEILAAVHAVDRPANTPPNLGPLQDNGGPTVGPPLDMEGPPETHLALPCSDVVDHGDSIAEPTDQRSTGFPRLIGPQEDIGSTEFNPPPCGSVTACYSEACAGGLCVRQLFDGAPCDNGIPDGTCQTPDVCLGGVCIAGGLNQTQCSSLPNFGIDCFIGCSNITSNCEFAPNSTQCDNGIPDPNCRTPDVCLNGVCLQSSVNDEVLCQALGNFGIDCFEGCDPILGTCEFTANGTQCDDGIPDLSCRTEDVCLNGLCLPSTTNNETLCQSLPQFGTDCFAGCSNLTGLCQFVLNGQMCTNGVPEASCQNPDQCINGTCTTVLSNNPLLCFDEPQFGIDCFQGCNSTTFECLFALNSTSCDDGIPNGSCQNPDLCLNGTCLSGVLNETLCELLPQFAVDCFTGCDILTGNCLFTLNSSLCDDGNGLPGTCQNAAVCLNGICVTGGQNQTLCEALPEFLEGCFSGCNNITLACEFAANGTECDDGIPNGNCVGTDMCSNGDCNQSFGLNETLCGFLPEFLVDCFQGCNATDGTCLFILNGTLCDDGNSTTYADTCLNGTCAGQPMVQVLIGCGTYLCIPNDIPGSCILTGTNSTLCESSDSNNCTRDYCNSLTGLCVHDPYPDGKHCYFWADLGLLEGVNGSIPRTCTTADMCLSGVCVRGADIICDTCVVQAGSDAFRIGLTGLPVSIPANFFGPGSDPFNGVIPLKGSPLEFQSLTPLPVPFEVHAIIERSEHAYMDFPSGFANVSVRVLALELSSLAPFQANFSGVPSPVLWNVECHLSNDTVEQPSGVFTLQASNCSCDEGGKFLPLLADSLLDCRFVDSLSILGNLTLEDQPYQILPPIQMPWFGNISSIFGNISSSEILVLDTPGVFVESLVLPDNQTLVALYNGGFYPGVRLDKCPPGECDFFEMCQDDTDCDDGLACTTDTCETIIHNEYEPVEVRYCVHAYAPNVGMDCYFGPPGTAFVGECVPGVFQCIEPVGPVTCIGMIMPALIDLPGDNIDSNCNGDPDS